MAHETWSASGVAGGDAGPRSYTGAAFIFVDAASGDNAIIISPGAAARIAPSDLDAHAALIGGASVFMTQLEQPLEAAVRGLEIARAAGVTTILNPAPARALPDSVLALCDWVDPERERGIRTDRPSGRRAAAARAAADLLVARGAGGVVITLGAQGALLHANGVSEIVPAIAAGAVVETTGAGDAFNGAFATGLAEGLDPVAAVRLATAVAGISVTRAGTAPSMPERIEVEALLART